MAAYVISDLAIADADAFAVYRTRAAASIANHGGRYLARGGEIHALEGTWAPRAVVIVKFPSLAQAHAWYGSPDYAHALEMRDRALSRNLILVDGIDPSTSLG